MTKRLPVSTLENTWFDSQQVDAQDLQTEQEHNDQLQSAVVNNHFGSGILPEVLAQPIILDTDTVLGLLDGKPILPTQEPSDSNTGVQLEIELMDSSIFGASTVFGRRRVKACIIGLDFNNNLQYDTFEFSQHQIYVTKKHYISVLSVLFNDMRGSVSQSFNLGGRVVIREAAPFSFSTDSISVEQSEEPNLFFRDFFLDTAYATLGNLLTAAVPGFSIDGLNISTQPKQTRKLLRSDVVTQLGQKFQASTNNIQKITLLLSVEESLLAPADINLNWTGDLIVSVYPLQSTVQPNSITPNLAIDFDPSNLPLAQASVNYATLQASGIVLDGYLQPVDFIFSNTPLASGGLVPGSFYAFTIKRSGSPDKANIILPVGSARVPNSRVTIFNGTSWVDIQEENCWFKIWTTAIKVSDGQAYDAGQGIELTKTIIDPLSGVTVDYSLDHISFKTTQPFYAVIKAVLDSSGIVQDQRTGNDIYSRKQFSPEIDLLSSTDLASLKTTTEPLLLGVVQDKNIKSFDSVNSTVIGNLNHFGFYKNEVAIKIIDSNTDPNNNVALITSLQNGDLIDATFIPNISSPANTYRIARSEILTMTYGDIDGDGIVDDNDVVAATALITQNLVSSPTAANYITGTNPFATAATVNFSVIRKSDSVTMLNGTCTLTPSSTDGSFASITNAVFTPTTPNFLTFMSVNTVLADYNFTILSGANPTVPAQDYGSFTITAAPTGSTCTIYKFIMTTDKILQILRANITSTYTVSSTDITHINNYALRIPAITSDAQKVGKNFRVLKLRLEKFTDRVDDYPQNISARASVLHPVQDIVVTDSTLANHNYTTSAVVFNVNKKLVWKSNLVIATRNTKAVPASFVFPTAPIKYSGSITGVLSASYPSALSVDPGRNDFYAPSNIILGGGILNPDGTQFKGDVEIGTIVLEIPTQSFLTEKTISIFTNFVADTSGYGITTLGYPCMRFADFSPVLPSALINNQVRFSASIQSFYSDINGTSTDGYGGVIVDPKMGVNINYTTGLLTLNFSHLVQDDAFITLNTKVQVLVFLKQAGFNNNFLFVDSSKMTNILGL